MPINTKLVNDAFNKAVSSSKWASQTNYVFLMGSQLFDELISGNSKEAQKKFYTILLGTIANVLAEEMRKYGSTKNNEFSSSKDAALTWLELYKKCDIDKVIALYKKDDPRLKGWTTENVIYRNTILRAGEKILNQEIPFDLVRMKTVFPELTSIFDEINSQYPLVAVVTDKLQTKVDSFEAVPGNLDLMRAKIIGAQLEYSKWYKGDKSSNNTRSDVKEGFFSRWRHGDKGQIAAQKLVDTLISCKTEDEAVEAINNFLTNPATRYHNHSFASYVLDQLIPTSDLPWTGISLEKDTNHYDKNEVINKIGTMALKSANTSQ